MHSPGHLFRKVELHSTYFKVICWLVDSIRAYMRVNVSGFPGNHAYHGYPGSAEFGCSRVFKYHMDFHLFVVYFRISRNFEYIFARNVLLNYSQPIYVLSNQTFFFDTHDILRGQQLCARRKTQLERPFLGVLSRSAFVDLERLIGQAMRER